MAGGGGRKDILAERSYVYVTAMDEIGWLR